MASRTLPNLGLKAFYDLGEDGWKDEQDLNLLMLSILTQGGVISKVDTTPGSPTSGDVYIFDETHATQANKVAVYDVDTWKYFTPLEGWLLYNRAANYFELFDGSAWAELVMGGGGGGASLAVVTTISAADTDLLNSHAGLYLRFTEAGAKTLTVQDDATEALDANVEFHIRNVGAADLTLIEDTAVTINVPNGGTLVIPQGGTATLKRVAEDEFDLFGQVVAA